MKSPVLPGRRAIPALVILLAAAPAAPASVIFGTGNAGGSHDNILFNDPGLTTSGTTIQGATNGTPSYVIDIASLTTNPLFANGGQSRVEGGAAGGDLFNGATFTPHTANDLPSGLNPSGSFSFFEANPNVTGTGSAIIDVWLNGAASPSNTFTLAVGPGENFFNLTATGGDVISRVTVSTGSALIQDIRQIRVNMNPPDDGNNGGQDVPGVPEPTSWMMWGTLATFLAAGAFWSARRRPAAGAP